MDEFDKQLFPELELHYSIVIWNQQLADSAEAGFSEPSQCGHSDSRPQRMVPSKTV